MSILACPVCMGPLHRGEKAFSCPKNHAYDIARSGYVNLLLSHQMKTKLPGDNRQMVQARTHFLNKGYYQLLADRLCDLAESMQISGEVLDAGCGEGYYTEKLACRLTDAHLTGIDISKSAVEAAAKRTHGADFIVGSLFHLPVRDRSCNALATLFAPYCGEEFHRVLKKGGRMLRVIPGARHLWELKELVYDQPYLNDVQDYALQGFHFLESVPVSGRIRLTSNEDIQSLFSMTPYAYKTSVEGARRLQEANELETQIAFELLVYQKQPL